MRIMDYMRPTPRQYSHAGIRLRLFLTLVSIGAAGAAGITGYAINPATGRPTLTGLMTTADEIQIGREQRPRQEVAD
jgi:hypothetical protein